MIFTNSKQAEVIICGMYEQKKDIKTNLFSGKEGEIFVIPSLNEGEKHKIWAGIGNAEELTKEKVRCACAKAMVKAKEMKAKSIELAMIKSDTLTNEEVLLSSIEGLNLADYQFNKYKTSINECEEITFHIEDLEDTPANRMIIKEAMHVTDSVKMARDLITEPTNRLYPEEFAKRAVNAAKENGFTIEILEEHDIQKLGMEAYLAVGKGSIHKPHFIIMRYNNSSRNELFGLVGKGLTCDTGGYSLKNSESLKYMKSDMSGAASVLAAMCAIAGNRCETNVTAVAACCENVVDGGSYKPGDVVNSMSGKTIEVLNTDAEGRLTLADALYYITEKEKVSRVIDIASLTGAAGVTFGNIYTPVITNSDAFFAEFSEAADRAEEKFWRMPNDKLYRDMINSKIADIKNTGGAGIMTAAMFLQEFVQNRPWIHIDIAGTAVQDPAYAAYIPNGPSGIAIRTMYELVKRGGKK